VVRITNDRRGAVDELLSTMDTLDVDDALVTPFLAIGTHDEIAAQLVQARQRWGISYFTVRAIEDFAPVIERLKALDSADV
ncbi:MAG: LLM class F420-dependent oxidoreductase, partial [Ilumatobacteraceae bacterium]